MKFTAALAAAGLAISAGAAQALTIEFGGLPGLNGDPLGVYEEDGFSVADLTGDWNQGFNLGNPVPSIFTSLSIPIVQEVEIKATSGGDFNFLGYDYLCSVNVADCDFVARGFRDGFDIFTATFIGPGNGVVGTFDSALLGVDIDRLVLSLDQPDSNYDNIRLTAPVGGGGGSSEVPLPASVLLLGAALGGLGAASRARGPSLARSRVRA
ncbi:MAG: hypothetical protein AAF763_17860 [Pseudomonadota bacterium]